MIPEGILVLAILGFLFFLFFNWKDKLNTKKLFKNYDDSKDKSKQGELRRTTEERNTGAKRTEGSSTGSVELEREELLQTTETIPDGETSNSTGKPNGLTNLFTKLRK